MSSIVLLLLLSQTTLPQDYTGKLPNFSLAQAKAHTEMPDSKPLEFADLYPGTCFTMRSYLFTRQDGNAPVLVGSSTCTPSRAIRMEQSKHHRGRLVLLGQPQDADRR